MRFSAFSGIALLVLLCACAVSPVENIDRQARKLGFSRLILQGRGFSHVSYVNAASRPGSLLHVYLEGDGSPWIREKWISSDPTPRHPVMLELMGLDREPSIYLGRPCYYGLAAQASCQPALWTHGRYSPEVIDSMAVALREFLAAHQHEGLVLLGHSGGGAIAMLLAEQFPQTRAVVTLSGNLDVDAWAKHHGYTPLHTSLNPARRPPLNPGIVQLHFAGGRDTTVPPSLISGVLARRPSAELYLIESYDHACCWLQLWPCVLGTVTALEISKRNCLDLELDLR